MNVKSNTGKALSLSILSTFLCLCMLFGMTYAWFKVSVESAENTIKIGAFEANVYYSDSYDPTTWNPVVKDTSVIFNTTLIPGTEVVRYFKLENECEYAVKFDIALPAGAALDDDNKASSLIVYAADGVTAPVTTESMTQLNNLKSLSDTATDQLPVQLLSKIVPAGESAIAAVGIKLPDTYNTVSTSAVDETFKLRFIATQWNIEHFETETVLTAPETNKEFTADNVTVKLHTAAAATYKLEVVNKGSTTSSTGNETAVNYDITLLKDGVKVESEGITVNIDVGPGKVLSSVKHNGVALDPADYSYDANTGILTFTTSSFSPFEILFTNVAVVGGVKCLTLDEAVEAAASGATIELQADIDYSKTYTERNARDYGRGHSIDLKDLTLDLNGHKISTINGTVTFCGSGATIKNGTFDLVHKSSTGTYQAGSYALIIDNSVASEYNETDKVTVKDVTCNGAVNVCGTTVELDNVAASTTATKYYTVWAEHYADVTIKSGTYTDNQPNGKGILATGTTGDEVGAKITINGGTFTGVNRLVYAAQENSIKIYNGTFSFDPTDYLATVTPFTLTAKEEPEGTWTIESSATGGGNGMEEEEEEEEEAGGNSSNPKASSQGMFSSSSSAASNSLFLPELITP